MSLLRREWKANTNSVHWPCIALHLGLVAPKEVDEFVTSVNQMSTFLLGQQRFQFNVTYHLFHTKVPATSYSAIRNNHYIFPQGVPIAKKVHHPLDRSLMLSQIRRSLQEQDSFSLTRNTMFLLFLLLVTTRVQHNLTFKCQAEFTGLTDRNKQNKTFNVLTE